jgi:hypothetical protein
MTCRLLLISALGHIFPHLIAVSPNPRRREVWLQKQVRMPGVELAEDDPSRQAEMRSIGRFGASLRRDELADISHSNIPTVSLYLPIVREFGEIAVSVAELPIPSRFLCNFAAVYKPLTDQERHI